jgi:hypothetical protein
LKPRTAMRHPDQVRDWLLVSLGYPREWRGRCPSRLRQVPPVPGSLG